MLSFRHRPAREIEIENREFGLGGGVYGRRSVGGALQGDRTVDNALTLNCVERNDRGMPVMRSPSNEVASCTTARRRLASPRRARAQRRGGWWKLGCGGAPRLRSSNERIEGNHHAGGRSSNERITCVRRRH